MTSQDVKKEILNGIFRSKDGLSTNELTELLNTLIEVAKREGEVKWLPYPENKPEIGGFFMVTKKIGAADIIVIDICEYFINSFTYHDDNIIAYSEIPKPYQSEGSDCCGNKKDECAGYGAVGNRACEACKNNKQP